MKAKRKQQLELLKAVLQAVKDKCRRDCCVDDRESWVNCTIPNCALYPYRLGNSLEKLNKNTKEKQQTLRNSPIVEADMPGDSHVN
jgi:hypothetical protein